MTALLSTSQAAELLGCSRQHVVDMCDRGEVAFVWIGRHRRLEHSEVDRLRTTPLTRDQERSLWLHRAVAGRIVLDPDQALAKAQRNIEHLRSVHDGTMAGRYVERWAHLVDGPLDQLLTTMTSSAPEAVELRQNTPFAGVIPETDRQACLAAFRAHWRREHHS